MKWYEHIRTTAILGALLIALIAMLVFAPPAPFSIRGPQYAAVSTSPLVYSFNTSGTLNEASEMYLSTSPYWWLNSGGQLVITGGIGTTMLGDAPLWSHWRIAYALSNPVDTDGGKHPQNIFRLVSRSTWEDVRFEAQFKILKDNWSESPNRNASNGLFLMNRYADGDTLYYAGLRVDGIAIIKKKYRGVYYTLAEKKEFAGTYVEGGRVNMLPHQTWIGLRSETFTNADKSVTIRLYMQKQDGTWKKLVEARDGTGETSPIGEKGFVGFRTDFMDVAFESVRIENI